MYGTELTWKENLLIAAIVVIITAAFLVAVHWDVIFK